MKFKFKRKYTTSFLIFLFLVTICVAFYIVGPNFIERETKFFNQILVISLIDSTLITIFILGLYRVNYYLYHDHLEIHRSLHKTIKLDYNQDCGVGTDYNADSAGEGLEQAANAYLGWVDAMRSRFPKVLFETCSSGGMRMDYQTLSHKYYS